MGGLFFGIRARHHKEKFILAAEGIGDSFALITWILFGAAAMGMALLNLQWEYVVYGILSLTLVRMVPVFFSLTKSGIDTKGKVFMGWFGPRGLASIVFVVMIQESPLIHMDAISLTVSITILLSVFAHGLSAIPMSIGWAKKVLK